MFVLTLLQVRCRSFLWFISIHFRFSCSKMPVGKRSLGAGFYPNAKVPAKKAVPLLREGFAIPIASAPSLAIESRPALPISNRGHTNEAIARRPWQLQRTLLSVGRSYNKMFSLALPRDPSSRGLSYGNNWQYNVATRATHFA